VLQIGGNTFYDQKNKIPMKNPEIKRYGIRIIVESRGTLNGFPNQGRGSYHPQLPHSAPVGLTSSWTQPYPAKQPTQPYNWRPATFVDEHHLKIQTMMEPLFTKFMGQCLVSNILTACGKGFDSLPWLDAYPSGVCWLHSIAMCPYGNHCTFAAGHVAKGSIKDAQANEVVAALQAGITVMVTREGPPSPMGKCKWKGGCGRGGGITPTTPQM
jgi:hypothetical protein